MADLDLRFSLQYLLRSWFSGLWYHAGTWLLSNILDDLTVHIFMMGFSCI